MRQFLISWVSLALTGCGSSQLMKTPQSLESLSERVRVKAEGKAKILVIQKLAPGASCDKVKKEIKVAIKSDVGGDSIPVDSSCEFQPRSVTVQTTSYVGKGNYEVNVNGPSDRKKFIGAAIVTTDCEDPEVNSGPDQDFGGAMALAENQTFQGKVDYANGNATNWIQLPAKSAEMSLFFLTDAPSDVKARLFVLPRGAKAPRRLEALTPKVKKYFRPAEGTLYVQVTGQRLKGEVNYSLTRKDSSLTKSVTVPVIDCYPVNANTSVVLLKPSEAMKVNDELQISAQKAKGGTISLGRCVVTSVSDSQVSCRMQAVPTSDLSHYRAQLLKDEGNS